MIKYLIPIILIVALCGCYKLSDKEQMPKISIEEVIKMDMDEICDLPATEGAPLIYDLCREIKRLRAE